MYVSGILQQKLWLFLYLSNNRVSSIETSQRKKKKKVKLFQNLNPGSVICIRYDFFIIY